MASTGDKNNEHGEPIDLDINGRQVRVTSPQKIFFSKLGATKLDLIKFYASIEGPLLAAVGGRPTLMQRFPDGASGKNFFQKRVPKGAPKWLETADVSTPNGTTSNALVLADLAHVVWAVNLGCLGFHPWPYQAARPAVTNELRIDLDPQPGTSFDQVKEAALAVRDLFADFGVDTHPKTSASKGIHIHARLEERWDSYDVRAAAVAAARELEQRRPDLLIAAWWKKERGERIFVDFNQNAPHKTVFGAWSVRARVGGQVSTPFRWEEMPDIAIDDFTIATVPARVEANGDPWEAMHTQRSDLTSLLELSATQRAAGFQDAPWPPQYPKQPHEPSRVAPSQAKPD